MNERIEIIIHTKDNFCTWDSVKNYDKTQLQYERRTVVSGKHAFFSLNDDSHETEPSTPFPFCKQDIQTFQNTGLATNFTASSFTNTNNIKSWEEMINLV